MLSPLKPLLCRHDFYWSERHRSERCRRCGKRQAAETVDSIPERMPAVGGGHATEPSAHNTLPRFEPAGGAYIDFQGARPPSFPAPPMVRPSAKVLKAEARERRDRLPELLDRLVAGARLNRGEALDAILAVIEDAHSADPVLFGPGAAGRFARLHRSRMMPDC